MSKAKKILIELTAEMLLPEAQKYCLLAKESKDLNFQCLCQNNIDSISRAFTPDQRKEYHQFEDSVNLNTKPAQ